MNRRIAGLSLVVVLGLLDAQAAARTTAAARFPAQAVAGPGVSHQVHLHVHYFPGDGEAVLRTEIHGQAGAVQFLGARSSRGTAVVRPDAIGLDYSASPVSVERVDTLMVELVWLQDIPRHSWNVDIYTTQTAAEKPAHTSRVSLDMHPPVEVDIVPVQATVFAGDQLELAFVVHNRDALERGISGLRAAWPAGIIAAADLEASWSPPLSAGQKDTLSFPVRLAGSLQGPLSLPMRVDAEQVVGSPVDPIWHILPLPQVYVDVPDGELVVGRPHSVGVEWINPGERSMALQSVSVQLGAAFGQIRASSDTGPGLVPQVQTMGTGGTRVEISDIGLLHAGDRIRLNIQLLPLRAGLHNLRAYVRPENRDRSIEIEAPARITVVRQEEPVVASRERGTVPDDLEMIQRALSRELANQRLDLPVPPGISLQLASHGTNKRKWVVADVLTAALMEAGYRVLLDADANDRIPQATFNYRIVDARVIYTPHGSGWQFWRRGYDREAYADVLLHLERFEGDLVWSRRVRAYTTDQLPGGARDRASSGDLVERTMVQRDNTIVERGLSAGIVAGLAYIFFLL